MLVHQLFAHVILSCIVTDFASCYFSFRDHQMCVVAQTPLAFDAVSELTNFMITYTYTLHCFIVPFARGLNRAYMNDPLNIPNY